MLLRGSQNKFSYQVLDKNRFLVVNSYRFLTLSPQCKICYPEDVLLWTIDYFQKL